MSVMVVDTATVQQADAADKTVPREDAQRASLSPKVLLTTVLALYLRNFLFATAGTSLDPLEQLLHHEVPSPNDDDEDHYFDEAMQQTQILHALNYEFRNFE